MRPVALAAIAAGFSLALGAAGLVAAQEISAPPTPKAAAKTVATTTAKSTATTSNTVDPATPSSPVAAPTPSPAASPAASSDDDAPAPKAAAKAPDAPPPPPPEPLKRPRFTSAIMQGVDKITAETLRFEAKVGEPVRYKGLILTVRACETTAADEDVPDSIAYVEVQSQPEVMPGRAAAPPRQVYKGWMYASSPTLHPVEHPIYDLWLIACKTSAPGA